VTPTERAAADREMVRLAHLYHDAEYARELERRLRDTAPMAPEQERAERKNAELDAKRGWRDARRAGCLP
jgi:hypothetical protein